MKLYISKAVNPRIFQVGMLLPYYIYLEKKRWSQRVLIWPSLGPFLGTLGPLNGVQSMRPLPLIEMIL